MKKWITFGDIADVFLVVASNQGKSTVFSSSNVLTSVLKRKQ
ncbi:hypothetical protein [Paenibacillus alvei]|nr:hypothetical protein [Paenibacillus alvei]